MTESKDVIKQGELILKSGILKQKHKRWCHLCLEKDGRSCSLECFENKDQKDKPKNTFVLHNVKTIDKVVKESSKDYFIEVHMKKDKFSLILSGQQETESWYDCLQDYSHFCDAREDSSYGGDDDDTGLKDNILYDSQPEETARFDVILKPNEDTERLELKSKYRLHVSNVCLMLEDLEKQEPKFKWYYETLRRYGKTGKDFTIQAGRRSASGEGSFTFIHEDASKITKAIDRLTKRKHNEQLTNKLNFSTNQESEKQVPNRISEPIPKKETSPVPPKKSYSLKEEAVTKQHLTRQHSAHSPSAHLSTEFKQELENTVNKSKTINEKSQKNKKEKQEGKEDKKKGFGFFKSKDKDKKSKETKNGQETDTGHKPYPKENLYDEPELPKSAKKPAEPIYEEADQVPTPARTRIPSVGTRSDEPVLYAQAAPNREHAWKNQGIQDEEHLENYDSIKAAASINGPQVQNKHRTDSEEVDDTYDHAFLTERNVNKQKITNDSKNIYGTASGKEITIPEPDYEGDYNFENEEPVEYYDAVSTQQSRKPQPPLIEAYEDVDLPS